MLLHFTREREYKNNNRCNDHSLELLLSFIKRPVSRYISVKAHEPHVCVHTCKEFGYSHVDYYIPFLSVLDFTLVFHMHQKIL